MDPELRRRWALVPALASLLLATPGVAYGEPGARAHGPAAGAPGFAFSAPPPHGPAPPRPTATPSPPAAPGSSAGSGAAPAVTPPAGPKKQKQSDADELSGPEELSGPDEANEPEEEASGPEDESGPGEPAGPAKPSPSATLAGRQAGEGHARPGRRPASRQSAVPVRPDTPAGLSRTKTATPVPPEEDAEGDAEMVPETEDPLAATPPPRPSTAARANATESAGNTVDRQIPVLTMGAGLAMMGLGLGFLGYRLRRR